MVGVEELEVGGGIDVFALVDNRVCLRLQLSN